MECLSFPTHLFVLLIFFLALHQLQNLSKPQKSLVSLLFPLPDVLSLHPVIEPSIFRFLGYLLPLVITG